MLQAVRLGPGRSAAAFCLPDFFLHDLRSLLLLWEPSSLPTPQTCLLLCMGRGSLSKLHFPSLGCQVLQMVPLPPLAGGGRPGLSITHLSFPEVCGVSAEEGWKPCRPLQSSFSPYSLQRCLHFPRFLLLKTLSDMWPHFILHEADNLTSHQVSAGNIFPHTLCCAILPSPVSYRAHSERN